MARYRELTADDVEALCGFVRAWIVEVGVRPVDRSVGIPDFRWRITTERLVSLAGGSAKRVLRGASYLGLRDAMLRICGLRGVRVLNSHVIGNFLANCVGAVSAVDGESFAIGCDKGGSGHSRRWWVEGVVEVPELLSAEGPGETCQVGGLPSIGGVTGEQLRLVGAFLAAFEEEVTGRESRTYIRSYRTPDGRRVEETVFRRTVGKYSVRELRILALGERVREWVDGEWKVYGVGVTRPRLLEAIGGLAGTRNRRGEYCRIVDGRLFEVLQRCVGVEIDGRRLTLNKGKRFGVVVAPRLVPRVREFVEAREARQMPRPVRLANLASLNLNTQ